VVEEYAIGREVECVHTSADGTRRWFSDDSPFDELHVDVCSVDEEGKHVLFDSLVRPGYNVRVWVQCVECDSPPDVVAAIEQARREGRIETGD
jgi:hypothetical protein